MCPEGDPGVCSPVQICFQAAEIACEAEVSPERHVYTLSCGVYFCDYPRCVSTRDRPELLLADVEIHRLNQWLKTASCRA